MLFNTFFYPLEFQIMHRLNLNSRFIPVFTRSLIEADGRTGLSVVVIHN